MPKSQTTSPITAHFQRYLPRRSAIGRYVSVRCRSSSTDRGELRHPSLRHADDTPLEGSAWRKTPIAASLKCTASPTKPGTAPVAAKKLAQHHPSTGISAKKLAQQAQKRRIWAILSAQGELFRALTHHQTKQGELFRACRRWPTSATPQPPAQRARQGLAAAPAGGGRAWPGRHPPVRTATRPHWCGGCRRDGGPGCGARGRWRGLAGLRDDAPSEARGAGGSRAGRRPRVHQAARPHNAATRAQPENATKSSPSEPCARAGASHPGRSGCGPRCAAPRLRCR